MPDVRAICLSFAILAAAGFTFGGSFKLSSPAFRQAGAIPRLYTCDGSGVSLPLRWTKPPRRTRSFALLVEDPDAPGGTFTHWLAWNLGAKTRSLPQGKRAPAEGTNDAGRRGYLGPCPPSGTHHYVFRLFALNTRLRLAPGSKRSAFLRALRGHVLATAGLTGTYGRA